MTDVADCPSCGDTAELFWRGDQEICADCIEKVRHPIETEGVTAASLLRAVAQLFPMIGLPAILVLLVIELPLVGLSWMGDESGLVRNFYGLISLLGTAIVTTMALQRVDRWRDSDLKTAIAHGLRKWGWVILALFVAGWVIMVFALLLVIPGILRALSYLIIVPLIVADDARNVDALELSTRRMKGHRGQAFWAWIVVLLPAVAGFLGYFSYRDFLMGQGALEQTGELSAAVRGLDVVYSLVYPLLDLPALLLAVALHVKLRPKPELEAKPKKSKKPSKKSPTKKTKRKR